MLKIRLYRIGKKKAPMYRVVIGEARAKTSKFKEIIGHYNPRMKTENRSEKMTLDMEKVNYWIKNGAHPTDIVSKFIKMKS
jgi:small subunit ribosomal protein S16